MMVEEIKRHLQREFEGMRRESEPPQSPRFPLEVLPQRVREIVDDLVKANHYSADYLATAMVTTAAVAIGNSVRLRVYDDWLLSPAFFTILVGDPGSGKSPALDAAIDPLLRIDEERIRVYCREMEEYKRKLAQKDGDVPPRPVLQSLVLSDFTPEKLLYDLGDNDHGLLLYVDELLGMFKTADRYNRGQLFEHLLTIWSGKTTKVSRVGMEVPILIRRPNLSIIGTMQTDMVNTLWKMGLDLSGFLDRCDFVLPAEQDFVESPGIVSSNDAPKRWREVIGYLVRIPEMTVDFTDKARAEFMAWNAGIKREVRQRNRQLTTRKVTRPLKGDYKVARLAVVIQALRHACHEVNSFDVDLESVTAALAIHDYYERSFAELRFTIATSALSPQMLDLMELLDNSFTSKDVLAAGELMHMSERSVQYLISDAVKLGIVRRVRLGQYEKSTPK